MYLYFDKTGKLKEIINDEALRQGNYGVNKMYIYIDGLTYSRIDAAYLLPSNAVVGPIAFTTFSASPEAIPFDPKRDLKYFSYSKKYTFLIIDLSASDSNSNSALDEAGVVHCELATVLSDGNQLMLGDVNFVVETSSVLNQKQVASQEYLSLADYLFIKKLAGQITPVTPINCVPYEGAAANVDLGAHDISARDVKSSRSIQIANGTQEAVNLSPSSIVHYVAEPLAIYTNTYPGESGKLATREWVNSNYLSNSHPVVEDGSLTYKYTDGDTSEDNYYLEVSAYGLRVGHELNSDETFVYFPITGYDEEVAYKSILPKKEVIGTFNTSSFVRTLDGDNYQTVVDLSGFMSDSDLLIITWDNCFAICPIPQLGAGRVCAAMWNSNGEAQTIRIRYELISNNTKLVISLQGGFEPPSNHTGYVINYKIIA